MGMPMHQLQQRAKDTTQPRTTGAGHLVVVHFGHIGNVHADDDVILLRLVVRPEHDIIIIILLCPLVGLRRVLLVLVGLASTVEGRGTHSNALHVLYCCTCIAEKRAVSKVTCTHTCESLLHACAEPTQN